ncbi:hypothetical protein B0H14DRAFT_2617430 [Mycena olivaceomarginata]|nr:hypothetical protein B0H14DRAFT_2617430 [Mycena olivaceomarginata]
MTEGIPRNAWANQNCVKVPQGRIDQNMAETGTSESYYDPASRSAQLKRIMESLDMLCSMVTRGRNLMLVAVIIAAAAVVIPLYFIAIKLIQHSTTAAANLTTAPAGGERRAQRPANPFPDQNPTPGHLPSDRIYDGDLEGWFVYDPCAYASLSSFFAKAQKELV